MGQFCTLFVFSFNQIFSVKNTVLSSVALRYDVMLFFFKTMNSFMPHDVPQEPLGPMHSYALQTRKFELFH